MDLEKLYDTTLHYQPASDIITGYVTALGDALADARNQAENNNPEGMAVAIGVASNIFSHLATVVRLVANNDGRVVK